MVCSDGVSGDGVSSDGDGVSGEGVSGRRINQWIGFGLYIDGYMCRWLYIHRTLDIGYRISDIGY